MYNLAHAGHEHVAESSHISSIEAALVCCGAIIAIAILVVGLVLYDTKRRKKSKDTH